MFLSNASHRLDLNKAEQIYADRANASHRLDLNNAAQIYADHAYASHRLDRDKAEQIYEDHFLDENGDPKYPLDPVNPAPAPYKPSAKGLTPAKLEEIDYINADLAKYYGMSKSTAYQEALQNTAYQREIKDMKAAGLNPAVMYSGGRASGADTALYASEERSGGGGYSRRRRGSGSSGSDKLFSPGLYYGISTAVGLATAVLTKNPGNYWIGSSGAQGIMGALNAALKK